MYHLLQNQRIMPDFSILSQSPVFKGLKPENIENLLLNTIFQVKRFQKNELIVSKGEPVKNLFIIHKGCVSGEMLDYSGKMLKVEDIEAPNPLATAFLFGNNNLFPVSVTATGRPRATSSEARTFPWSAHAASSASEGSWS